MYSQLDQLLVEAEELNVDICDDYEDLPRIERNFSQLLNEAREMQSRLQESSDTQAVQANLLLSSCGVNLPQMSAQLEAISSQKPFELLESTFESDIAKQINEQWQTLFLSTLEQNNQNTFQNIMNETIQNEILSWNQTAKNFMDSFVCPNGGDNDFKVQLQTTSTNLKGFPKQTQSLKDNKLLSSRQEANLHSNFLHFAELEFAKVIQKYNERLVYGDISPNDLFPMLREVVDKVPEASNKEVWRLVEFMSKVRSDIDRFERDTSTETNVYRCDEIMVGALVKRAKQYLENRYRTFMENLVTENLEMAKRGGVPGLLSLVLAFINVRLKNGYANMIPEDKYDKRPLWPIVYYCIRSGDLQAALFVLNSVSGERFANLKAFLDVKVSQNDLNQSVDVAYAKSVHKRLSEEFALVRNSFDIYKRATFTVLVGTEADDFLDSQLFKTTDDDLWSKLCLIYGSGSLNMDENGLTYNKIQKGISEECGENYYRPYVYFELLMLTGQFEIAIDFLWRLDNSQKVKALHMAIALNELGLLNITKSAQAPLLQKERKINSLVCWLNLVRMVVGYTRVWEANEPFFALNYFFLLRHIPDIDNKTAFLTQVARLVISTGNIDEIFGTLEIGSMGQSIVRLDGLIDKFFLEPVQVMSLINYTAEELEKRGFIEQSIIVYSLANSEQKVLSLTCRFLSQILSMKIGTEEPPAVKERFLHFCRTILSHQYPAPNMISCSLSTTQLISTLHILLRYSSVLELIAAKRIEEALERCTELDLLPKTVADVEEKVTLIKSLSVEIHNVLPDIMVTAMKMLHTLSKKVEFDLSKVDFVDIDTKTKLLKYYKDRAKAITHFAGMIPLVISEELCSNLIRLEIEMNS